MCVGVWVGVVLCRTGLSMGGWHSNGGMEAFRNNDGTFYTYQKYLFHGDGCASGWVGTSKKPLNACHVFLWLQMKAHNKGSSYEGRAT